MDLNMPVIDGEFLGRALSREGRVLDSKELWVFRTHSRMCFNKSLPNSIKEEQSEN
jgi:hypothetical protein